MRLSRLLRVALLLPPALLIALPLAAQIVDEPPSGTGEITGTLTFLGCTPSARDFEIFGVPMIPESESRVPSAVAADLSRVGGILTATRDPHVFSVSLPAVQMGVPYQLRVLSHPPSPCKRVFWEGPEQGIAFAGVPVRLIGYSPRSQIEVKGTQVVGVPRRGWVGAETIDVQNFGQATRQLRWFTELAGVTGGLIQVSTEEFPKQDTPGRSCVSAPGLVYQSAFAAKSGQWNMLPTLNFAAIAAVSAFSQPGGLQRYNLFTYGAPLYVRVIPIAGRTYRCSAIDDGPAPWVVLANAAKTGGTKIFFGADPPGPPPPAPITLTSESSYTPPWFWNHPKGGETAYRVVHEHKIPSDIFSNYPYAYLQDPFAFQFAKFTDLDPGDTIPIGYHFWFKPGSDGFDIGDVFEGAVSIVTGVVDAVGFIVNEVSKAYDSIKKSVAKIVTSAISATGLVDCEASAACRSLVESAITTGLAVTGMPPAVPNWHDFVDKGFEYFAAEVVTQAGVGNVPGAKELTKAAAKKLVEEAVSQMDKNRGGGGDLPKWLMVDLGQEPAVLVLELTTYGQTTAPLFPNHLKLSSNPVFLSSGVDVPSAWPRETNTLDKFIKFPVVLRPNLAGFTPPKTSDYASGIAAKGWWQKQVEATPCVKSDNQFMIKTGPLLVSSTYTLTSLSFDPQAYTPFPPFLPCSP